MVTTGELNAQVHTALAMLAGINGAVGFSREAARSQGERYDHDYYLRTTHRKCVCINTTTSTIYYSRCDDEAQKCVQPCKVTA